MAKVIACGSVVPGCNFVIHGADQDEIMAKMVDHLRSTHDVEHLSEQLKARIRAVTRDNRSDNHGQDQSI
jgi:predicted small metal-binding protein